MRKRILGILFTLCMVLCLVPMAVLAAGTGSGTATPSGTPLTQEMIESKKGSSADEGIQLSSGSYYLESDIYLVGDDTNAWSLFITSSAGVTLDLNGHVLDLRGAHIICFNGTLTLKDSNTDKQTHKFREESNGLWVLDEQNGTETVTGGVIIGGVGAALNTAGSRSTANGGGVAIYSGAFTMESGSIVGCTATAGGGVYVSYNFAMGRQQSTFTMESGSISGCTANDVSNAVHADGTFTDNGSTKIDTSLLTGIGAGHTGTKDDPILIASVAGLKDFRDRGNAGETGLCAKLTCDIVLNTGTPWTPIGTDSNPYAGTFDGQEYAIKGMVHSTVVIPETAGLFGYTDGATIRNVAVDSGTDKVIGRQYAGGIVGYATDSTIENCANLANISTIGTIRYAGGIVGYAEGSTIHCCYNAGGIIGYVAGGIAGYQSGGSITNSYFLKSKVSSNNHQTDNAVGESNGGGTQTSVGVKTKDEFANGAVLTLLQNGDANSPWTNLGYLEAVGLTLPLLKGQTADDHDHSYTGSYSHDETHHWQECACGKIISKAAHSFEETVDAKYQKTAATCTAAAVYYKSCADCGVKATETFTSGNPLGHTGGKATCTKQAVCTNCGEKYGNLNPDNHTDSTAWIQAETKHTQIYKCCGAVTVGEEPHEWKNGVCSECGYNCKHTGGTATCIEKAVCDYCKQKYGDINPGNHANLRKIPAVAATVESKGSIEYFVCDDCKKLFADDKCTKEIKLADTVTEKAAPTIISGADAKWYRYGQNEYLEFRSDALYSDFISVSVDGKLLDESQYEKRSGSIIIRLKADYLNNILTGKHTISITSVSGDATASFVVTFPDANIPTGDSFIIWLAAFAAGLSGLIAFAAVYTIKKSKRKDN